MKKLALISALALAGLAGTSAHASGTVWAVNGHTYEFIAGSFDWAQASADAASKGGYLATVTSADENAFINGVIGGQLAWLGGTDSGFAINDWHWAGGPEAGQAFSYTNWQAGEPNNCCNGEDYLQINWATNNGTWNDHGGPGNGYQQNGYVLETSAAVPEPGAYAMFLAGLASLALVRRRRAR